MRNLNFKILSVFIIIGLMLSSCETVQNTNKSQRGAAIGAVAGAGLGALIGKNNRALGAIVGGAVGGTAGAIIGKKMDDQAKKIEEVMPGAEVVRSEEGIQVILDENSEVRFEYNKSSLTASAKENLDRVIEIFNEYPLTDILIVGHTDNVGSQEFNQPLSLKRAKSVSDYLTARGISSDRIVYEGAGKLEPRYSNETAEGRAGNRRVEFAITANEQMIEQAEQEAQQAQ
ncbi:OmpA family protein [Weeksellaceae bacterium KMM 9713]|uniref:OmpA family protein n=1 Tax=Profundicola chukchiensis TaxID=2961959 RepID=A0A9X4MYU3_9FLAO|nr:OmpA family protein [Profundicola chukchiensis]MDG4945407.1 OmpA family protein [Profundicola chukchiensis]